MSDQSDQKKEKMERAKKCLKTCGIISGIGLVVFGVTLLGLYFWFKGGSKQQTQEEIQELQKYLALPGVKSDNNYIEGTFELKSFAPNYDEYMGNFGMPSFVIAMVKASSETIYVTDFGNGTYHMKNAEALYTSESTFNLGEPYSVAYIMGTMHNSCTKPEPNVLFCYSYEPEKKWNITSEMTFSKNGLVNKQTYLAEDVSTKKFYTRKTEEEQAESEES